MDNQVQAWSSEPGSIGSAVKQVTARYVAWGDSLGIPALIDRSGIARALGLHLYLMKIGAVQQMSPAEVDHLG